MDALTFVAALIPLFAVLIGWAWMMRGKSKKKKALLFSREFYVVLATIGVGTVFFLILSMMAGISA